MFKNFSFLATHQFFKLLVPLLLIPYFLRVVGAENWGKIVYTQYLYSFFIMLISYGFDVYGVKLIADNKHNKSKLNEIVSSVFIIKALLFCISIFIIFCFTIFSQKFAALRIILLYSIGLLFFQIFNSIWIFQGIEKMYFIPIITCIESIIFLSLTFIFIHGETDYLLIPLIQSISLITSGLLSLLFVVKYINVSLKIIPLKKIIIYVKESFEFFLSRICNVVNSKSSVVAIGLFLPYQYVSYFDLSLKIIQGFIIPFGVLSEVIFPRISQSQDLKKANQALFGAFFISIFLYIFLFITCDIFLPLIGGDRFLAFKSLFLIIGLMVPIEAASYILGTSFLVSFGFKKVFNRSVIIGTSTYLMALSLMIYFGNTDGITFAILIAFTAFIIFCIRFIFSIKYKLFRPIW